MRWLVLTVLLFLPTASAFEMTAPRFDDELIPDQEYDAELAFQISCQEALDAGLEPTIRWSYEADHAGIHVSEPTAAPLDLSECLEDQMFNVTVPITVSVDMTVPSEVGHKIRFDAWVNGTDLEATQTSQVVPAYAGTFTAQLVEKHKTGKPQRTVTYEIELENFANGQSMISFELVEKPKANVQPIVPDQVILGPAGSEEAKRTVEFVVATAFKNGGNDRNDTTVFTVHAESIKSAAPLQEPIELDLSTSTKGVYVPGPGLIVPLLAALALRRRLEGL